MSDIDSEEDYILHLDSELERSDDECQIDYANDIDSDDDDSVYEQEEESGDDGSSLTSEVSSAFSRSSSSTKPPFLIARNQHNL